MARNIAAIGRLTSHVVILASGLLIGGLATSSCQGTTRSDVADVADVADAADAEDADVAATPPPGSTEFILDDEGAVLLLRGVDVDNAAKNADDLLSPITEADAERIAAWGFNFVRLLVFWEAVEPEPGVFDEAYLAQVRERLDLLHSEEIHVMIDMHQDVYAARFCCDGAPDWAIRDDGLEFTEQSQWFTDYYQPAVQRAFDNFWDSDGPHADLQTHYAGA